MSKDRQEELSLAEKAEAQRVKFAEAQANAAREKELARRKAYEAEQKKHANVVAGNLKVG